MINFLLWSLPFLGISMLIFPIALVVVPIIGWLFGGDKWGARMLLTMIVVVTIWGLWIGCYHVFPIMPAYNNMCPPDQQTAGYCDTGTK